MVADQCADSLVRPDGQRADREECPEAALRHVAVGGIEVQRSTPQHARRAQPPGPLSLRRGKEGPTRRAVPGRAIWDRSSEGCVAAGPGAEARLRASRRRRWSNALRRCGEVGGNSGRAGRAAGAGRRCP